MRTIGTPSTQARKLNAIASGALPNGDPVVVNADGTVSAVSGGAVSESVGSPVAYEADSVFYGAAAYDASSQKVVIAYRDLNNSNRGTAIVGTVSGTSISFGTPVVFYSGSNNYNAITYDANSQKVVIAFTDASNGNRGLAIVGTISGTSISFGSSVIFNSNQSINITMTYHAVAQKVVIAYRNSGTSTGSAIVGTVSGTSISFGSSASFSTYNVDETSISYDAANEKVIIGYKEDIYPTYPSYIVAGTVSGTSLSFGTPALVHSGATSYIAVGYDADAQKVIASYADSGNSYYGTAVVGTVSGTSISLGSPTVYTSSRVMSQAAVYHSDAKKTIIAYQDFTNSNYGKVTSATISGTSLSFTTPVTFYSGFASVHPSTYDANSQKVVIAYRDNSNSGYGTAVTYAPAYTFTNITSENFIGTAQTGAADGNRAVVNIKGSIDENQSGLTAGQSYYVQTDGTLGTTPADPSVFAGTAISATKMIVKG